MAAVIRIAFIASAALLAAACASPRQAAENAIPNSLERFPLTTHAQVDETLLAVHGAGLSGPQQDALEALSVRWREAGGQTVTLRAPQGLPDQAAANAMAYQARAMLVSYGIPEGAIRIEAYAAPAGPAAPLAVRFDRHEIDVPQCGREWDNLTGTQSNGTHSNFGCAVSANMAAQIANPADVVALRAMDPSDAGRRSVMFENYRKGDPTGAKADPQGSGAVSQAIK